MISVYFDTPTFIEYMEKQIWEHIARMDTSGFFVTAEMKYIGNTFPNGLEAFIQKKWNLFEKVSLDEDLFFKKMDGVSI